MADAPLSTDLGVKMNEQTWIDGRVDRSKWGPGDWDGEPDKAQWTDEATGLVCLAKRHYTSGNWCGYVGVAPGHPWHGKGYNDCDVDVHGGLTFADTCQEGPPEQTICHIPAPGEPDGLWWLGFDCHHAWDLAPGTQAFWRERGQDHIFTGSDETYRTLGYVKRECAKLAQQIAAVKS
jgi:hypothetical protein